MLKTEECMTAYLGYNRRKCPKDTRAFYDHHKATVGV